MSENENQENARAERAEADETVVHGAAEAPIAEAISEPPGPPADADSAEPLPVDATGPSVWSNRAKAVAGGGDTVAALNHAGVAGEFTFVSTAGGAFLEWMEGKTLPGVAALQA